MSAWTQRWLSCEGPGCSTSFQGHSGRHAPEGITDVRKRARAEGWTHPAGYIDLCPRCTKEGRAA